jgi:hypothetical protein
MTGRAHDEAIHRVGEALAVRYTEVGQAIAVRAVDEIPSYTVATPELISDLEAGAMATVELFARTLAEGSTVRREHLGFLRELAARRVHQGVGLEAFLRAYRVALLTIWDACAEEAARLGVSREAGSALARAAIDAIDIITTQAAEAYLREETRLRTQSGRASRDLLDRLIDGQPTDAGRRHPAAPGLDPSGRLLTIVGTIAQTNLVAGDALQLAWDALEETMSLGTARPLAAIRHGELVLVTATTSAPTRIAGLHEARRRAIDEHDVDVHYGVSLPSQGFASVQQAYREAVLALSYTSTRRPIVSLDDLSALECALVAATSSTKAIIAAKGRALRALSETDREVAVETIRAFAAADLNVARAAERMNVHPNTVRYRLEQLAAKTGHDPRTFAGLVELICVLETTTGDRPAQATPAP